MERIKGIENQNRAFIILPWGPENQGGVTGVVLNLIERWDVGSKFELVLSVSEWSQTKGANIDGKFCFRYELMAGYSWTSILKALPSAPGRLYALYQFLENNEVGVVNFHYPGYLPLGVAILKRFGLYKGKIILSYHGTDVSEAKTAIERKVRDFIVRSSDKIVACSPSLAKRIEKTYGINSLNLAVIYNGVDTRIFSPEQRKIRSKTIGIPEFYITNIGAFIEKKSPQTLMKAFVDVLSKKYPSLHLCFAGHDPRTTDNDTEILPKLKQMAKEADLDDRVHFYVGLNREEVAHLLSNASACVQTSESESFPLAVLEAAACGIPVIATNIPGHRDIILHKENGLLYDVGDIAACTKAVEEVIDNTELADQLRSRLNKKVSAELTWEATVSKYEKLYSGEPAG